MLGICTVDEGSCSFRFTRLPGGVLVSVVQYRENHSASLGDLEKKVSGCSFSLVAWLSRFGLSFAGVRPSASYISNFGDFRMSSSSFERESFRKREGPLN